ncbi:hypothetical protein TYRP_018807 [Tyrophagus putrescentiae]|nr:hypothetical protein TYRP_018807 [Tyrophagus putrescentiae]
MHGTRALRPSEQRNPVLTSGHGIRRQTLGFACTLWYDHGINSQVLWLPKCAIANVCRSKSL